MRSNLPDITTPFPSNSVVDAMTTELFVVSPMIVLLLSAMGRNGAVSRTRVVMSSDNERMFIALDVNYYI